MDLSSDSARAQIDVMGGRVASLKVAGMELLVDSGPKPTRWGSFPMVPWCGRLADARLGFHGATYDFPQTSPPHANHGFGHTQLWKQTGDQRIELPLGEPWPFGGTVSQSFEISDEFFEVTIELRAAEKEMPAMAGWHPWFRRELGVGGAAELSISGGQVFETDAEQIPTGRVVGVPPGPWDHCFVGLEKNPVIEWPGALRLELSSSFDHWVIFTEPAHALCVEPQSGPPNQLNAGPKALEPGASLVGSMRWSWEVLFS